MGEIEDKRNKSNLSNDEFYEVCKKEICDNQNVSYLIKELLNNDCLELRTGYYWLKDAVKAFIYLDEYLKHNVDSLESYELSSRIFLDANKFCRDKNPINAEYYYNHPIIKVCTFDTYFVDNPYHIVTDGYPGEFHYVLKDSIRTIDAVNKDIGVLCIHARPCGNDNTGTLEIEKDSIDNGYFTEEDYHEDYCGGKIFAVVYDIKKALDRKDTDAFNGSKAEDALINPYPYKRDRTGIMGARKPWFIEERDCVFNVTVYYNKEFESGEYGAEYCDDTGRHFEKIYGDSLYSAYYNFMIEKGYFKDNSEKLKENRK